MVTVMLTVYEALLHVYGEVGVGLSVQPVGSVDVFQPAISVTGKVRLAPVEIPIITSTGLVAALGAMNWLVEPFVTV